MWPWSGSSSNFFRSSQSNENGRSFRKEYQCYPASFIDREDMEKGNKIALPHSAMKQLTRMWISWPMMFMLKNEKHNRVTHCGVLEFIAKEGHCYMPYWMMQNLLLKEGDHVTIENASLPKGTYVKLQPISKEFGAVSNPKAVLENALRNYAALTVGDNIVIQYMDSSYEIEVLKLEPANAVTIIETDVEVEFQYPDEPASNNYPSEKNGGAFSAVSNNSAAEVESTNEATSSSSFSGKEDQEPWRNKLLHGIRTYCEEYEMLLNAGKIPGVVGKLKTSNVNGGATNLNSNFNMFGGAGNFAK